MKKKNLPYIMLTRKTLHKQWPNHNTSSCYTDCTDELKKEIKTAASDL